MPAWLAAALTTSCGPWITTVPTYWEPVLEARTRAPEAIEPPVVAVDTPSRPQVAVEVPEDTPKECRSVFAVTANNRLYAFHPETNTFELQGALRCSGAGWATPFSMGVARTGAAQVLFTSGQLFEVDVHTAACRPTSFERNQRPGFRLFGMGYAHNRDDAGESLYVAEISFLRPSKGLATIDLETGELNFIAPLSENPGHAIELTPTGGGPLVGYFLNEHERGGTLVEIDPATAAIVKSTKLDVGTASSSLAIAWFAGYFYIFTAAPVGTEVTQYDPDSGESEVVAKLNQRVVGAGVSTCAPGRHAPGRHDG